MSRVQRLRRRRAGDTVASHERARGLAAEQLDSVLAAADETWLAEHLAGCDACRSVASAYEADRVALRSLRDRQPEAPRDLWARTAAAMAFGLGGFLLMSPIELTDLRGATYTAVLRKP